MSSKNRIKFGLITLFMLLPSLCAAESHYGANISIPLESSEPANLHGYQLMVNYDPDCFQWRKFNVYFDGGYSHFWLNSPSYNSTISVYSAAPVIRYTFRRRGPILPFLELSIGLSYLNHTRIDSRNLGIHFAFQDRMGLGALIGHSEHVSLGVHAVHYSNAHLSNHNSGMTIPLVFDIGYRF